MDPRLLPFQIASGLLLAGLVVLLIRYGMNIFRNNKGLRGFFGAGLFCAGITLGWAVMLAGFNP
jgi:hypothetical protein